VDPKTGVESGKVCIMQEKKSGDIMELSSNGQYKTVSSLSLRHLFSHVIKVTYCGCSAYKTVLE